jgi:hypothetical protein
MIPEAPMDETETGRVATGDGWFVLNAKDARWYHAEGRPALCNLEGETFFPQVGINIVVLGPGQPMRCTTGRRIRRTSSCCPGRRS